MLRSFIPYNIGVDRLRKRSKLLFDKQSNRHEPFGHGSRYGIYPNQFFAKGDFCRMKSSAVKADEEMIPL
jgi:hypothetical protein